MTRPTGPPEKNFTLPCKAFTTDFKTQLYSKQKKDRNIYFKSPL